MSDVPGPSSVPPAGGPAEVTSEPASTSKRVRIWALSWRFVKRVRPYLGRLAITMAVAFIASGAKATQVGGGEG